MKNWFVLLCITSLAVIGPQMVGADDATQKNEAQPTLAREAAAAIELFKKVDPKMAKFFKESAGYAVFPSVGKGGLGIGAAHGKGVVYAKGKQIGTATMTQFTIGAQLGGQSFAEVIFFETQENLDSFAASQWTMNAQATAVAAAEGVGANAKYNLGVMVFTLAKNGLMFEASVGGQKFKFTPLKKVPLY